MLTFDSKGAILQNKDSKSKPTGDLQQKTPVQMYPKVRGCKIELQMTAPRIISKKVEGAQNITRCSQR